MIKFTVFRTTYEIRGEVMTKILQILMILCLFFSLIHAETNTSNVKVAFIRDGYLW